MRDQVARDESTRAGSDHSRDEKQGEDRAARPGSTGADTVHGRDDSVG